MTTALQAVKPGESPLRPLSISAAAESGDRRQLLVAMRARVSSTLDDPNTSPRDLAALTRRASELDKEIRDIDATATTQIDPVDDGVFDAGAI